MYINPFNYEDIQLKQKIWETPVSAKKIKIEMRNGATCSHIAKLGSICLFILYIYFMYP